VYCETPALPYDSDNAMDKADPTQVLRLRVLNAIGYGFDSHEQADHRYFLARQQADPVAAASELLAAQRKVFVKILGCVRHFNEHGGGTPIKWMHVPGFGCGAFAGDRGHEVNANFEQLYAEFEPKWRALGVTCSRDFIYPSPNGEYGMGTLPLYPTWLEYQSGTHPDGFGDLSERLFINAWDPHSLVGNGNFEDASMDGYYGRSTAMALLCWPPTNPILNEPDKLIAVDESGNCVPPTA